MEAVYWHSPGKSDFYKGIAVMMVRSECIQDIFRGELLWIGCWVGVSREKGGIRNFWFEHLGKL